MLTTEQRLRMMETPQTTFDLVIDTDAYNEIDDQFAISYALRRRTGCICWRCAPRPFIMSVPPALPTAWRKAIRKF